MIPSYKILTSKSFFDFTGCEEDERKRIDLVNEQDEILKNMNYDIHSQCYAMHFFDGGARDFVSIETIYDSIQGLAIKEGANLVRFENGNVGYIALYGGYVNGFEIIQNNDSSIFNHKEFCSYDDIEMMLYYDYDIDMSFNEVYNTCKNTDILLFVGGLIYFDTDMFLQLIK